MALEESQNIQSSKKRVRKIHESCSLPLTTNKRQVACERGWCSLFSIKLAASGIHNSSQFQSDNIPRRVQLNVLSPGPQALSQQVGMGVWGAGKSPRR